MAELHEAIEAIVDRAVTETLRRINNTPRMSQWVVVADNGDRVDAAPLTTSPASHHRSFRKAFPERSYTAPETVWVMSFLDQHLVISGGTP